jgi:hypothetical protein
MIQVVEKFESPENWTSNPDNPSGSRVYMVMEDEGTELTEENARAAVSEQTEDELTIGTTVVYRQEVSVSRLSDTIFLSHVRYGISRRYNVGESTISISTIGGSQHIDMSIATVATYGGTENFKNLLNVRFGYDKENNENIIEAVDGVEIPMPVCDLCETHWKNNSEITENYRRTLAIMVGKINNASFRGFAAGELQYLGAELNQRKKRGDWEISYHFAACENQTNITIGGITGINKKGWEYIWPIKKINPETKLPEIVQINVEQIYPYANFSALEI